MSPRKTVSAEAEVERLNAVVRAYGLQMGRYWALMHQVVAEVAGPLPDLAQKLRTYMRDECLYKDLPR